MESACVHQIHARVYQQQRASDLLEAELQVVARHHVGSSNGTQVLFKSNNSNYSMLFSLNYGSVKCPEHFFVPLTFIMVTTIYNFHSNRSFIKIMKHQRRSIIKGSMEISNNSDPFDFHNS